MAKNSRTLGAVKMEDDWQTEDDMRTLMRCREIEKDQKRMAKVRVLAKKRLEDMAGVIDETNESE